MLEELRTVLLITLAILVVTLLVRRFKRHVMMHDLPVAIHAELLTLEVSYHPLILRMHLRMPREEDLTPRMLNADHVACRSWPMVRVGRGEHVLELPLDATGTGTYFLELATEGQRTERRFNVRQA